MAAVIALSHLARLHMRRGQLHQAGALYEQALQVATDRQGRPLPIAGEALMGLGGLMYEWNELDRAAGYLEEGIELTRRWRAVAAMDGYVFLARLRQAQGDVDGAEQAIQQAMELAILFDAAEWDDMVVAMMQARLWIARGNLEGAEGWLASRGLSLDPLPEASPAAAQDGDTPIEQHLLKYEYLVVARLLLARGEPGEALALLDWLLPAMKQSGRTALVIEIQILRALVFQSQGDAAQAAPALEHALALAEPSGYVRIFADEGEPMARLLRHAGSRGIQPDYVRRLLAAIELSGPEEEEQVPAPDRVQILIDPLSEREMEVLRLLATGLTNPEIGEQLFIAPSTVRSHVKNIYSKLNVHKRWDAVQRAEELGLL
jgi:LuxR family maltose regulon positive regulatory protein